MKANRLLLFIFCTSLLLVSCEEDNEVLNAPHLAETADRQSADNLSAITPVQLEKAGPFRFIAHLENRTIRGTLQWSEFPEFGCTDCALLSVDAQLGNGKVVEAFGSKGGGFISLTIALNGTLADGTANPVLFLPRTAIDQQNQFKNAPLEFYRNGELRQTGTMTLLLK